MRNRPYWSKYSQWSHPCWSRDKWGTEQLASQNPGQLEEVELNGWNHITWGGRKHYTYPHNFLFCLLAPWTNSDRQVDPIVKKRKLKLGSRGEKKWIHMSNGLHSFSFPRTSIIEKRFVYFGRKLTQVKFPNLGPFLFATSVYWQNILSCEIILE